MQGPTSKLSIELAEMLAIQVAGDQFSAQSPKKFVRHTRAPLPVCFLCGMKVRDAAPRMRQKRVPPSVVPMRPDSEVVHGACSVTIDQEIAARRTRKSHTAQVLAGYPPAHVPVTTGEDRLASLVESFGRDSAAAASRQLVTAFDRDMAAATTKREGMSREEAMLIAFALEAAHPLGLEEALTAVRRVAAEEKIPALQQKFEAENVEAKAAADTAVEAAAETAAARATLQYAVGAKMETVMVRQLFVVLLAIGEAADARALFEEFWEALCGEDFHPRPGVVGDEASGMRRAMLVDCLEVLLAQVCGKMSGIFEWYGTGREESGRDEVGWDLNDVSGRPGGLPLGVTADPPVERGGGEAGEVGGAEEGRLESEVYQLPRKRILFRQTRRGSCYDVAARRIQSTWRGGGGARPGARCRRPSPHPAQSHPVPSRPIPPPISSHPDSGGSMVADTPAVRAARLYAAHPQLSATDTSRQVRKVVSSK